jgi:hypothetical protein
MCLSVCHLNNNMPTFICLGVEIQHEVLVVVERLVDSCRWSNLAALGLPFISCVSNISPTPGQQRSITLGTSTIPWYIVTSGEIKNSDLFFGPENADSTRKLYFLFSSIANIFQVWEPFPQQEYRVKSKVIRSVGIPWEWTWRDIFWHFIGFIIFQPPTFVVHSASQLLDLETKQAWKLLALSGFVSNEIIHAEPQVFVMAMRAICNLSRRACR